MCGIIGALLFRSSNFRITECYITKMRDSMAHRGPDAAGTWIAADGRVGLGHRRLTVVDLSEVANQPMNSTDGALWISFNGEIYNHKEIRKELNSLGEHHWKTTHSDTEVILNSFRQWGIDCVNKFRGMFAFVLWDTRSRDLWLVRDRIGIKPLYYSIRNNRITFASQANAILQDPDQERAIDEEGLYHYLTFSGTPAPRTLFDGIKKVPPATWLKVNEEGLVREHRYWDVLSNTSPLVNMNDSDIAEGLLERLKASVQARKVSDIPLGMFLSSGLDSSTIAALMAEGENRPIRTFTIGNRGSYPGVHDETGYAQQFAHHIGAQHDERLLNDADLSTFVNNVISRQDEPIADPVCVSIYHVSKLAQENGVHVCLVGDGSDELFCGYPHYQVLLKLQRLNELPVPRSLKALGLLAMRTAGMERGFPYERLRRGTKSEPIFWSCEELFTDAEKKHLLSPRLREKFKHFNSSVTIEPYYQRFRANSWEDTHFNWMSFIDMNLRIPEVLVQRHDKMGMSVSVEVRLPFLDHKVVEYAMSIPTAVKLRNGNLKYILKKAMKGRLPDDVITRGKGFMGFPIQNWFVESHREAIRQDINEFCDHTDLLDRTVALRLVDENRGSQLWSLASFIWWWKSQIKQQPIEFV